MVALITKPCVVCLASVADAHVLHIAFTGCSTQVGHMSAMLLAMDGQGKFFLASFMGAGAGNFERTA